MSSIRLSDGLADNSYTVIENRFITKYMPEMDPVSLKVYLYSLYVAKNGKGSYTFADIAKALGLSEDESVNCAEYLEEYGLISVTSRSPFEYEICDISDAGAKPRKIKPEKYAEFCRSIQSIITGRMVSTSEYREYIYLLEDCGFEEDALIKIVGYCVSLKGPDINWHYIRKVALNFAEECNTTLEKVNGKIDRTSSVSPALSRIYSAAKINRSPDVFDEKLYEKWSGGMGFGEDAIICAAKNFKAHTPEKLDAAMEELFKNRKFSAVEIEGYCREKNSVFSLTYDIARSLGVYMQQASPYVETYVSAWIDLGFDSDTLKIIASQCFRSGRNSFADMDGYVKGLLKNGFVDFGAVQDEINRQNAEDGLISKILSACGLNRKIIANDRTYLTLWREWGFGEEMMLTAAALSAGKSNPLAYMNGILSSWKASGYFTTDALPEKTAREAGRTSGDRPAVSAAAIEEHYSALRRIAEDRAEKTFDTAMADSEFRTARDDINSLTISLTLSEIRGDGDAEKLRGQIREAEEHRSSALMRLGIDEDDFRPHYSCPVCSDTGYDGNGKPCECLKKFLSSE